MPRAKSDEYPKNFQNFIVSVVKSWYSLENKHEPEIFAAMRTWAYVEHGNRNPNQTRKRKVSKIIWEMQCSISYFVYTFIGCNKTLRGGGGGGGIRNRHKLQQSRGVLPITAYHYRTQPTNPNPDQQGQTVSR